MKSLVRDIACRDLGQAMGRAALAEGPTNFQAFNIVGSEVPSVRDVILFLHREFGYPNPHVSVLFGIACPFAWLMEKLDRIVPWQPLIVRSIVHLSENTGANNDRVTSMLGYRPEHHWQDAVCIQIAEMAQRQTRPMALAKAIEYAPSLADGLVGWRRLIRPCVVPGCRVASARMDSFVLAGAGL